MGAPALIAAQSSRILDILNAAAAWHRDHVLGAVVTDGGTTQASGAGTAPNLDLDVSAHVDAVVDGTVVGLVAAAADIDADAGDTVNWGATSGVELTARVELLAGGTYVIVPGAVAATGASVRPTDAETLTAVGEASVTVADVVFARTGDTTITVTIDHTTRPSYPEIQGTLDTREIDFADQGATRVFPITTDPPPSV